MRTWWENLMFNFRTTRSLCGYTESTVWEQTWRMAQPHMKDTNRLDRRPTKYPLQLNSALFNPNGIDNFSSGSIANQRLKVLIWHTMSALSKKPRRVEILMWTHSHFHQHHIGKFGDKERGIKVVIDVLKIIEREALVNRHSMGTRRGSPGWLPSVM